MLNGIARAFGVFDHWFSEVPSQTFMNRSFWTAATLVGLRDQQPGVEVDTREHRRDAVRPARGARAHVEGVRAWNRCAISFTGLIHMPRLKDRLATHFVPFSEFEHDAANGTLPDFSLIEPNLIAGHSDYHPA